MPHLLTEYVGALERWGKPLLRPYLQLVHGGPRAIEVVAVRYESTAAYDAYTVTSSVLSKRESVGRSKYVRLWVYNAFGFLARHCQVFLDRISLDGKVLDDERTPLHWTDVDVYEFPSLRRGYRNGHYIDVCAADSIDPQLQLLTQKGLKGYHRYPDDGVYTIELTAEADKPCSFGSFKFLIGHDGTDWQKLAVIAATPGPKWLRWS
jgi:hypothetical protein